MEFRSEEREIVQQLTGVPLSHIVYEDFGWTSRVYIVSGGEFVVKFPRSDEAKKEYEREKAMLQFLTDIELNVQIPQLRWTHPTNDYLGYAGIVGQPLDRLSVPPNTAMKKRIGYEIGRFTKQLHGLKLESAKTMTPEDEIRQFQERYALCQDMMRHYFSDDEQAKLKTYVYDELPQKLRAFENDYVLCHGDLGYWNILVRSDGGLGVIDFGDVGYYDRSKDFIGMVDPEALDAALAVYGDDPTLRQKIVLRKFMLRMPDLIFFRDKNDEKGIAKTVKFIKAVL